MFTPCSMFTEIPVPVPGRYIPRSKLSTFEQRQTTSQEERSMGERGTVLLWSLPPCLLACCCCCSTTAAAVPGSLSSPIALARRLDQYSRSRARVIGRCVVYPGCGRGSYEGSGTRQHEKATPNSSPCQK